MSLTVQNIKFGYTKDKYVLNDISFEVEQGETLGILGVSGSGKSTLIRVIAGLQDSSGTSHFEGVATFNGLPLHNLTKTGELGFMFQEATLMPNLNVNENISLPLKILNHSNESRVADLITSVGLKEAELTLPKNLSGGMKTRVALARSFVMPQLKLLMLDEPFSALDVAWKAELYAELKALKSKFNASVLFVTHDILEALELSDKILVLGVNGTIINRFFADKNSTNLFAEIHHSIINDHNKKFLSAGEK